MKDSNKTPTFLRYSKEVATKEQPDNGKIATALSKQIAYERTPTLFDEEEIGERDRALTKAIQELKLSDVQLCIDRKGKPVYLTSIQARIITALSYGISRDTDPDVKASIADPLNRNRPQVRREVNITDLSRFLFGKTTKYYKEQLIREIFKLSKIRQYQDLSKGEKRLRYSSPLISLGEVLEDLTPEKSLDADCMEITFGRIFFFDLDTRFAYVTPKLFEVWRKGGRGTELFHVLLNNLLWVYWQHKKAAKSAEERIRGDKANKKLPKDELESMVANGRKNAMSYELNVSNIKNRVTRDYESNRSNKAHFYKDLNNAIEGFKELGLIVEAHVQKGARGQEKVTFVFSETYGSGDQGSSPKLLGKSTEILSDPEGE